MGNIAARADPDQVKLEQTPMDPDYLPGGAHDPDKGND